MLLLPLGLLLHPMSHIPPPKSHFHPRTFKLIIPHHILGKVITIPLYIKRG